MSIILSLLLHNHVLCAPVLNHVKYSIQQQNIKIQADILQLKEAILVSSTLQKIKNRLEL